MNKFQICRNTSDSVPLFLPLKLHLKPAAIFAISVQIPNVRKLQKSISHWEIMEKLRALILPDEFSTLKVGKTTLEVIRFDAELDNRTRLDKVLSKLDKNSIKLKEIPDLIRVKATETVGNYPTEQQWDSYFSEAKDMNEAKPGQRPDTIHISHLPRIWFTSLGRDGDDLPSEKLFYQVFEKFGEIRSVDVPICDPYRAKMKRQISGFQAHDSDEKEYFEGYVQFKEYMGFSKAVEAFKGMKLLQMKGEEFYSASVVVDFDRTRHLSDAFIRRREIVRERLVRKQVDKDAQAQDKNEKDLEKVSKKEQRRKEREARRKAKHLEKLKINDCDEINRKIAKEERKLLTAQRKLEAIRLIEELFKRIKEKKHELSSHTKARNLNDEQLKRYKNMSELAVLTQKQKVTHAIEGRIVLKKVLSKSKKRTPSLSSSESEVEESKESFEPSWYNYPYITYFPAFRGGFNNRGHFPRYPGPSRGRGRFRGNRPRFRPYMQDVENDYGRSSSQYYNKSRSRSRSRRRSYSRSNTRSRSLSRRRSYTSDGRKSRRSSSVDSRRFISPRSLRRKRSRTRTPSRD